MMWALNVFAGRSFASLQYGHFCNLPPLFISTAIYKSLQLKSSQFNSVLHNCPLHLQPILAHPPMARRSGRWPPRRARGTWSRTLCCGGWRGWNPTLRKPARQRARAPASRGPPCCIWSLWNCSTCSNDPDL